MLYSNTTAPSVRDHPCLVSAAREHPNALKFGLARIQADGPEVERWFVLEAYQMKKGKVVLLTRPATPLTFCPFCGAFLLVGDPSSLVSVPAPETPPASLAFAVADLREDPPASDVDEGVDDL